MSRSWAGGSTWQWRRIRAEVLARDGYLCQIKTPGTCTVQADQVHHVLGREATGDDPAYCQAACRACNLAIGNPAKRPDPAPRPTTRW